MTTHAVRLLAVLLLALTIIPAVGCSKNVATGRSQFNSLSREEEIQLGTSAMPELINQYGGRVPDAELQAYVTRVGQKVAAQVEEPYQDIPWEFTFLDSEVINAFALPGGKVFITRGLVSRMSNESQLAGVLGHEVGHVTAEHIDDRIGRQTTYQILGTAASVAAGASGYGWAGVLADAGVTAGGVFMLKFDRAQEDESDKLGMRYMSRAGYNPRGQLEVMQILRDASKGASQPEWMSTHPLPESRIKTISERLESKEWQKRANDPSLIVNEDGFKRDVLDRLKRLPPPKQTADAADFGPPAYPIELAMARCACGHAH